MPRIPKHRQTLNPPIDGYLVNPQSREIYRGNYVRDYRGRFYEGVEASFNNKLLDFVPFEIQEQVDEFTTSHRIPTERDYTQGFFVRYFIQDLRDGKIVEVDQDTFTQERTERKIHRRTYQLNWLIRGKIEDYVFENGYSYPGIRSQNQELINQGEKSLPGIGSQVLINPIQFVKEE